MIRHSRAVLLSAVGLWLFIAPLPFGGTTAVHALEIAGAGLLAATLLVPGGELLRGSVRTTSALLLALAAWGMVQAAALPHAVVEVVSPRHAALWRDAASHTGAVLQARLSLAPWQSVAAGLLFLLAAVAVLLGARVGETREGQRVLAGALLGAAVFQILYGAPRWLGASSRIWGVEVPGDNRRLRGSFVNPDHFSLFLEIALAVAFAVLWWGWRRARRGGSAEKRVLLVAVPVLVWSLLFAGIAFSGSRAGLIAAATATVGQGLLLAAARRRWSLGAVGAGVLTGGVLLVASLGAAQGFGRLLRTSSVDVSWTGRLEAWEATVDLWRFFPWTGSGLGTFAAAFPLVQPAALGGFWNHAHNDPLELLATGGPAAALLLLIAAAAQCVALGRTLRSDAHSEERAPALAALGAILAVAVHEMFDFGLTMPANLLALALVCGAGAAARARTVSARPEPTGKSDRDVERARRNALAGNGDDL